MGEATYVLMGVLFLGGLIIGAWAMDWAWARDERRKEEARFSALPQDGEEGFMPSVYIQYQGLMYVNEGDENACSFRPIDA